MYLNDRAILETQTLTNLIPFAVVKNDPSAYYPKMVAHAKFLNEHRSITIKNISKSDYASVESEQSINSSIRNAPLKNALRANRKISAIHEHLDNNCVTLSVTTATFEEISTWVDSILPMYAYKPCRARNPDRPSTASDVQSRPSKYAKVFAPTADTDSTADSSFDPSTIASVRTPRPNAWSNGPPLNVTFARRARSKTVSVNPTPQTRTFDSPEHAATPTYETYKPPNDSDNDDSDATPISRPFSATSNIAEMVEKAIARERSALDARIAALEAQQQKFLSRVDQWDQQIVAMRTQIVDATVTGTMSVLTGETSPFATKDDAQQHREQTAADLQELKEAVTTTNNNMLLIQQSIAALLHRTDELFESARPSSSAPSPKRKTRVTDGDTSHPADFPMANVEGVGNS
jgi:hypothetical protein